MSRHTSLAAAALVCALSACAGGAGDAGADVAGQTSSDAGPDTNSDTAQADPATHFCQCMIVACHEAFHEVWGPTDAEAIPACLTAAAALPEEATAGSGGLPCWLSRCQATPDPTTCTRIATLAPCPG